MRGGTQLDAFARRSFSLPNWTKEVFISVESGENKKSSLQESYTFLSRNEPTRKTIRQFVPNFVLYDYVMHLIQRADFKTMKVFESFFA